ncbi:MAG: aspartate dehydrogenase [Clostridiales bacterium]|nr:aspartate dehydrogenase [Clostridiales bacterium]
MSPVRTSFIKSLFKPRRRAVTYDPAHQEPVIHKSICTGEATVGLVDTDTGKYHELRRVTGEKDIVRFCKDAGIDREKIKTIY